MPGLDAENLPNRSDQLFSSSQAVRHRTSYAGDQNADSASSVGARSGGCPAHVATPPATSNGVRKFTSKELSQLNGRENAHVAYRGKVHVRT